MKTKQAQTNLFNGGLNYDTNPLMTPENIMTDCVNGTLLTYNGNELVLQNDSGNVPVDEAILPEGYVPLVSAENNGVLYIVSHNPTDKSTQIGTYPSPLSYAHAVTFSDTSNQEDDVLNLNLNDEIEIVNVSKYSWPVKFYSESEDLMLNPGDKYKIVLSETLHPAIEIGFYAFVDNVLRPIDLTYYTNNQSAGYVTYLKPYAAQLAYQYRFKQIEAYDVTASDTSKQSTLNLTWSLLSKDYAELENPNITYYNRVSLYLTNDTESKNYFGLLSTDNKRKYSWEKFNLPTQNTFTVKNSFIDTYTNTDEISSCLPSLNFSELDNNDNIKWDSQDGVLVVDGVVYNKLVIESTPVVVIQNGNKQQQIVYDTLTNIHTELLQNIAVESHIRSYKYKVLVKGKGSFIPATKSDIVDQKDTYTNVYIEFDYDTLSGQLQSDQINYISIKVSEITEEGLNDLTTLRLTQADKSFKFDDINPDKNIYFIESNGDNNILKISLWLTNDIVLPEMPYALQFNFGKNKIQTPVMFFKSVNKYQPSFAAEPVLTPVSKNINGFYEVVSKLSGTKVKIETQSVMPLPYRLKSYLYPDMIEATTLLTPAQDYIVFDQELLPGIHEFYDSRGTLAETVVINTQYLVPETAQYLIESITPSFYTFNYIENKTVDYDTDPLIVGDDSGSTTPETTLDGYYTGTIFTKNSSDTVIRLKVADGSAGTFTLREAAGRFDDNVIATVYTPNGIGELTLTKDLINKKLVITFTTSEIIAWGDPTIISFDYKNIPSEITRVQNTSISTTVSMINSFLMNYVDSNVLSYNDLSFNEWFNLNEIIDGDLSSVLNGYKLQSESDVITLSTNSAPNRSYNYEDNTVNYKYDFVFTDNDVVNGQLKNDSKPQLIWTRNHNFVIQPPTNTIQSLFPDIGMWKNIKVNYSNPKPTNTNLDNLDGSFNGGETNTIDTNVQHTVKKILKMDFKIHPKSVEWNYDRKYLCENTSWTEYDTDAYYTKNKTNLAWLSHKPVKWECIDVTGGWEYAEGLIEFKINNTVFLNWIQTNGVVVSNKYRLEPLFDTAQQFWSKVQHRWSSYVPNWEEYSDNNHSTSYTYLKEMFFKGLPLSDCEILIGQSSNDYPIFPTQCGDSDQKHVTLIFPAYSSIPSIKNLLIPGALGFSNVGTDAEIKVIKLKSFLSRHLYAKVKKTKTSDVYYLSEQQDQDIKKEDIGALSTNINLRWTLHPSINDTSLIGLGYYNSFTNNFIENVNKLNSIDTTTTINIDNIPSTEIENYSELERSIRGTFSDLKMIAPKKSDYHCDKDEWNKVFCTSEGWIINGKGEQQMLNYDEVLFLDTIAGKLHYHQNRFYLNTENPYEINPDEMRVRCFAAGRDLYDGEERPCWPIAPIEIINWDTYSVVIDQLIGKKFDYVDIRY